jgi:class 3 adenylate cyclase/tetratricopeptide (TPR) repeat protein
MSATLESLTSYLPALAARHHAATRAAVSTPSRRSWQAALLFVDISGFTALTERLARRGPVGVEELTRLLNVSFGQLLDTIEMNGGDVVKFAGDALMAVWVVDDDDLAGATRRAAWCALEMHGRMRGFARLIASAPIALRIGVAAGPIDTNHIGGVYGRWEFLITGAPLEQVGAAEGLAKPGEVVLAPSAHALLADAAELEPLPGGAARLAWLRDVPPQTPLEPQPHTRRTESLLRAYVPGAVLSRFVAGQTAWLTELRRVSVIFAGLPDVGPATPLDRLQTIMETLQRVVYRHEGSVNKIALDDKGVTFMAALGLPPLAHEDDAARALQAALDIRSALEAIRQPCSIGVTTGATFCGEIGSQQRREYTMIGDVVNLAARLMQAAAGQSDDRRPTAGAESQEAEIGNARSPFVGGPPSILCDEATATAARGRVVCDTLPPLALKGKAEPVAVFAPRERQTSGPQGALPAIDMVGRERELGELIGRLSALLRGDPGGLVMIESEAGMGKSRLLEHVRAHASGLRLTTFSGAGEAAEQTTPYYIWRGVFSQMFDLSVLSAPEARRRHMLDLLEDEDDILPLAPLLNAVLPLDLPDNEITSRLVGNNRATATQSLLLHLLQRSAERSPKLVVLENLHWGDSASWNLLLEATRQLRSMLLVTSLRPLSPENEPPAAHDLRALATVMRLDPLTHKEAEALVCRRLGVSSIPPPVAELIREKAGGHPFFCAELAYALRDTGVIQIVNGVCELTPGADVHELSFPESVQSVIVSRVDRLSPTQQLLLKVASVIGRAFAVRALRAIFPLALDDTRLAEDLATLAQLDLVVVEPQEMEPSYSFRHAITQEVVYNLMLFAQRRQLHRAVAEWYERAYADDLTWLYQLLAHHWRGASVPTRAIGYLERAGQRSLAISAVREARTQFTQALELLGDIAADSAPDAPRHMITLNRLLGDAERMLGNLTAAREAAVRSLNLARDAGDSASMIDALSLLGWMASDMGEFESAQLFLDESVAQARAVGDTSRTAQALSHMANNSIRIGQYDEAERAFQQALALFSEVDDPGGMAQVLNGLGNLSVDRRQLDTALYCYQESLLIRREMGDRWGQAICLNNLGWVAHLQGDLGDAVARYEESMALSRAMGDRRGTAVALNNLAFTAIARDDAAAAARYLAEGLRLALAVGVVPLQLELLVGVARLLVRAGQRERAAELLGLALRHPSCNTDVRTQAELLYRDYGPLLPPEIHTEALERGHALDLDQVIADLSDWLGAGWESPGAP